MTLLYISSQKNYPMKYKLLLIILQISILVHSEVNTYPGADNILKSVQYEVRVSQNGIISNSFVYADENTFSAQKSQMTDWNHWTCFSFSGTIEVKVTKLTPGAINTCKIYPISDSIQAQIDNNTVTFTLNSPKKLHIAIGGMYEQPLFIFADAPETDIPKSTDANVVYWGPGIHNIGEHYPLNSNTTYYLAGGAYVKGSFLANGNATNVRIRGRGILSGIDIAHCNYSTCKFDKTAILLASGSATKSYIEGITITNPGQYCIQSYGGYLETNNVKCFGWWYETDGWVGGNNSKLWDSFFKVYDDVIKLYFQNMQVSDLVIYHQHNGAPFQFGWGSEQGANCLVSDIDIITDESISLGNNHTLLNCANGSTSNKVTNMKFDNIRVDQNLTAILGLKSYGIYTNIEINNLQIRGKVNYTNYINYGIFNNIVLKNISVGGFCVDNFNQLGLLNTIGAQKQEIRFAPCNGPFVTITSPLPDYKLVETEWLELKSVSDETKSRIVRTELYINGIRKETFSGFSNSIQIKDLATGKNEIKLIVYDANNQSSSSNVVPVQVGAKELVCNYKFEGNGFDETGRYNGWMNNNDSYQSGKSGLAPVFDGIDDQMKVANHVFGNMTYAFWMKTDQSTDGVLWQDGVGLIDGAYNNVVNDFGIMLIGDKVGFGIGNPDKTILGHKKINDNLWHYIACTRDNNTGEVKIYIDGILDITDQGASGYRDVSQYITIGSSQVNSKCFRGVIDELRYYNYVLNEQQIQSLMQITNSLNSLEFNNIKIIKSKNGFAIAGAVLNQKVDVFNAQGMSIISLCADAGSYCICSNNIKKGLYIIKISDERGNYKTLKYLHF